MSFRCVVDGKKPYDRSVTDTFVLFLFLFIKLFQKFQKNACSCRRYLNEVNKCRYINKHFCASYVCDDYSLRLIITFCIVVVVIVSIIRLIFSVNLFVRWDVCLTVGSHNLCICGIAIVKLSTSNGGKSYFFFYCHPALTVWTYSPSMQSYEMKPKRTSSFT